MDKNLVRQQDHYDVEKRRQQASDERDTLNLRSKNLITMRSNGELTKDEFTDEIEQIRIKIVALTSTVTESVTDRNEVQVLLTQAKLFITRIEPLYLGFSTTNKQRFISLIFPNGIRYKDGILRTPEKSYLFRFIEELQAQKLKKTTLVNLRKPFYNSVIDKLTELGSLIKAFNLQPLIFNTILKCNTTILSSYNLGGKK